MQLVYDASRIDGMNGKVILSEMSYIERMKKIKQFQFKLSKAGEVDNVMDNYDSMIEMIEFAFSAIKEVDVKHKSGVVAKTAEDLNYKREFAPIMQDLASFYFNAGSLGNS